MKLIIAGRREGSHAAWQGELLFVTRHAGAIAQVEAEHERHVLLVDPETFEDDPFALIRQVQAADPARPILVALHPSDHALAARCSEVGVIDLVAKPIDWRFLELRLPILLRSHQDRLEAHAGLRFALSHDALTGLPNRAGASQVLANALIRAQRTGSIVGVLCLDLVGFERVNEMLGIRGGDQYLRGVVERVRSRLRQGDLVAQIEGVREGSSASRLGGHTFGIFAPGLRDASDAARVARRIIEAASAVVEVAGCSVSCTANVGIAMFPIDADEPESLLQYAESVTHRLKAERNSGFEFYSAALSAEARRQLHVETELRSAIDRGEVKLHYQPKVDLRSGGLSGMEALIRWQSESLGRVAAPELIEAAERTGLIAEIGRWVMWEACAQNREWQQQDHCRVPVSVNVSASQLRDPDFEQSVIAALTGTGLEPRYLQLEVTESILIENSVAAAAKLAELRMLGVTIALDDFGAGYASLAYLIRYPLDVLKLDRQFITGMTSSPGVARIVECVMGLARGMGLRVVAEGVDDPDQLPLLEEYGCDEIQGFLVSQALPKQEFVAFLKRTRDLESAWLPADKAP